MRGRLTLLVAAVVLPALVFAVGLSWQSYRRERASLVRQTESTARALRRVLEGFLREKEALLRGLAVSRNLETGDLADFYTQAKEALPGQDEWVVLIGPDGQQLLNTHLPMGSALPKVRFREDFRAAANAGRTYFSRLTRGPASKEWVVFVAIPIRENGELRYTLNLAMRPSAVGRALLHHGIGDGWTVTVIDREARIIARNRGGETFLGRQASGPMLEAVRHGKEGSLESHTLDGIPTISAFSRSPATEWGIIIGAPRAELYASAQQTLTLVLAAAVVLAILTSAMAWWAAGCCEACAVWSTTRADWPAASRWGRCARAWTTRTSWRWRCARRRKNSTRASRNCGNSTRPSSRACRRARKRSPRQTAIWRSLRGSLRMT